VRVDYRTAAEMLKAFLGFFGRIVHSPAFARGLNGYVSPPGPALQAKTRNNRGMGMAEVKRACALFTTMVVLFTLVHNNPLNDHHITQDPSRHHPPPALERDILHNTLPL
jgi:hypothetical protein